MYLVKHNGETKAEVKTEDEALRYISKNQGQSWQRAMRWEGWTITEVKEAK